MVTPFDEFVDDIAHSLIIPNNYCSAAFSDQGSVAAVVPELLESKESYGEEFQSKQIQEFSEIKVTVTAVDIYMNPVGIVQGNQFMFFQGRDGIVIEARDLRLVGPAPFTSPSSQKFTRCNLAVDPVLAKSGVKITIGWRCCVFQLICLIIIGYVY